MKHAFLERFGFDADYAEWMWKKMSNVFNLKL
jgi:hypothetical protein